MKKQLVIIGIIILIITVSYCGCLTEDGTIDITEGQKFFGTWQPVNHPLKLDSTFIFNADSTFHYRDIYVDNEAANENRSGTFTVRDGRLILTYENSEIIQFRYIFSQNNSIVIFFGDNFDYERTPDISQFTWHKI